jgi:hypothetical protein
LQFHQAPATAVVGEVVMIAAVFVMRRYPKLTVEFTLHDKPADWIVRQAFGVGCGKDDWQQNKRNKQKPGLRCHYTSPCLDELFRRAVTVRAHANRFIFYQVALFYKSVKMESKARCCGGVLRLKS